MISRRILAAVALLCAIVPAHAQKTKAQLSTEIGTTFPDNTIGAIQPSAVRAYESDVINSILPPAPVVSGNLACFNGTTGLLQDCGSSPTTTPIIVGTTSINGGTTTKVLFDNAGKVGEYTISGSGSVCMTTSCAMTSPNLDTPTAITLTNGTGLPISTGVSGLGAGVITFLGTPNSANLASAIADQTGTGVVVYSTSPTLTTPTLGAASATSINKLAITAPSSSATLSIANLQTLSVTGTTSIAAGQYQGEASTGTSAAGNIGEFVSSNIVQASAVNVTTSGTAVNITSISLTAGDWDVWGQVSFLPATTTSTTFFDGTIHTVTAAFANFTDPSNVSQVVFSSGQVFGNNAYSIPPVRIRVSLSGTTNYFLNAQATFTVSTMKAYGFLSARRAR